MRSHFLALAGILTILTSAEAGAQTGPGVPIGAAVRVEMTFARAVPQTGDYAFDSETTTQVGWVLGAGAEFGLGPMSIKGEFIHFDLGEEELRARGQLAGGGTFGADFEPEFETKGNIGRVGLNFHLN